MPLSLLSQLRASASALGVDLIGLVDAGRFDAGQTKERRTHGLMARCGVVVVLGSGGKGVGKLAPVGLQTIAAPLRKAGLRVVLVEPERRALSFARLAEAAGFGTVSPVTGMLLHPQFGPWVRVQGAVLVEGQPFGSLDDPSITDSFQPCCKCRMPCLEEPEPAASCHLGAQNAGGTLPAGGPTPTPLPSPAPMPSPAPAASPSPAASRAAVRTGLLHVALRFVPRFRRR